MTSSAIEERDSQASSAGALGREVMLVDGGWGVGEGRGESYCSISPRRRTLGLEDMVVGREMVVRGKLWGVGRASL